MPKFKTIVNGYGTFIIEGEDMYDADEKARNMSRQEVLDKVQWLEVETNRHELPEEV